ncbi:MAG: hypothetical protein ACREOH_12295 [Candidatus Entotheonellia bacterium]
MQYVILGQHPPDLCPTSNAKTRQRVEQMMHQLDAAQKNHNVHVLVQIYPAWGLDEAIKQANALTPINW